MIERVWESPPMNRLSTEELERLAHKRAFTLDATMVELVLVERDAKGWHTGRYRWPSNVFAAAGRLPVASATALRDYRAAYAARHAA